ncbi:MAG: Asp-tRNA(Asn)/Glu-tRNA(Gln) amidotransferase subunit GatB [Chitinophagaceae bacterium]|nr:Asp-tRNA(Asn)/Glu-tRNA(Gln) amidotransferase subunit GatB [Chitinophagaceae bacterium]
MDESFETVIGLEIHVQLQTASKLFSRDAASFGAEPNTHISAVTLGYPGTLPVANRKALEYAVKMGLACHCRINRFNYFARKHYFYPDLPKGYQITQHTTPICTEGYLNISISEGEQKRIRINRIHLEEDAGKSIHPQLSHEEENQYSFIDFNRAGCPLIEIVTEPDLRSGEEAAALVAEIRKLVRYLGISDGNMEEGNLRCDANISVRKKGEEKMGTKVEVKNLNSLRFIRKAVEWESERMAELLRRGEAIRQETRSFDAVKGITFSIRVKEESDDYRYFIEPDIPPFFLPEKELDHIKKSIPALPEERKNLYVRQWQLPLYDADVITEERAFADYFEEVVRHFGHPPSPQLVKAAANWMMGPVKNRLNEDQKDISAFSVTPLALSKLIRMTEEGKISFSTASGPLLNLLIKHPGSDPQQLAVQQNLLQQSDRQMLERIADKILERFPEKVQQYRKGKKGLLDFFVGEMMKQTKGKADPRLSQEILVEKIKA